jgi:hypothetical protein
MRKEKSMWRSPAVVALFVLFSGGLRAQTDLDGIMMAKQNLCIGGTYSYSSWDHYWEGTLKRNNLNLGTVSTQMAGLMATYGITKKLNVLAMVPYVTTHSTAGTLHGQKGIQDLSAWVKWDAVDASVGSGVLSLYLLGGASVPLTDYIADYLPLSIGLQSKTLSGRFLADFQSGNFFMTGSATYTWRSNITIDRNAYYTTELHLTNEVDMPDFMSFNYRIGYRSERWIAEAVADNMTTIGGFDIRRNDMPFPSNKMNSTMVGAHFKYNFKKVNGLAVIGGGDYTVAGRNVGQSAMFDAGVFYTLDFSHKSAKKPAKK